MQTERPRWHRFAAWQRSPAHDRLGEPDVEPLRRRCNGNHARRAARASRDGRGARQRHVHRRGSRRRPLTIPVVRAAQNRVGAISTFIVAITIQGSRGAAVRRRARRDRRPSRLLSLPPVEQRGGCLAQWRPGARGRARPSGAPQHGAPDRRDDRVHRRSPDRRRADRTSSASSSCSLSSAPAWQ